ncbi:hypothetical protein ACET3Z_011617 [Daucus carota]
MAGSTIPANVQALAMGPDKDQVSRHGYKVNGREEVVDGEIYQEQMLNKPTVVDVDENEVIELDGGDDPHEIDSELILVPDDMEMTDEELLTDSDIESNTEEDDGYESAGDYYSDSDTSN